MENGHVTTRGVRFVSPRARHDAEATLEGPSTCASSHLASFARRHYTAFHCAPASMAVLISTRVIALPAHHPSSGNACNQQTRSHFLPPSLTVANAQNNIRSSLEGSLSPQQVQV